MGLLEPIFRKIAALPLIGPHAFREADLMLAGAKPVAMIWANFPNGQADIDRLNGAVAEGRLISREAMQLRNHAYRIYTRPGHENDASQLAKFYSDVLGRKKNNSSIDALHTSLGVKNVSPETMNVGEKARFLKASFSSRAFHTVLPAKSLAAQEELEAIRIAQAARMLQEGRTSTVILMQHEVDQYPEIVKKLDQMAQSGEITVNDKIVAYNLPYMIYGQPGQEENMARLEEMNNMTKDPGDPAYNFAKILGYSDQDQEYFAHRGGDMNPLVKTLIDNTNGLRRDLRVKLMLQDGPNWNRNP